MILECLVHIHIVDTNGGESLEYIALLYLAVFALHQWFQ